MRRRLIHFAVAATALVLIPAAARAQARDASTVVADAWITTQIHAKFFADPDIKGRNINVDTMAGVVTLGGEVHSAAERSQAIAKARATDGVKQVVDKLTLTPAGRAAGGTPPGGLSPPDTSEVKARAKTAADRVGKELSDTWITTKVQAMFFLDREVKGMQIDVTTNGGIVTLSGTVDREATRQKAVADARSIEGVSQVVDKLAVKK